MVPLGFRGREEIDEKDETRGEEGEAEGEEEGEEEEEIEKIFDFRVKRGRRKSGRISCACVSFIVCRNTCWPHGDFEHSAKTPRCQFSLFLPSNKVWRPLTFSRPKVW